jgi:hypothetical protein
MMAHKELCAMKAKYTLKWPLYVSVKQASAIYLQIE